MIKFLEGVGDGERVEGEKIMPDYGLLHSSRSTKINYLQNLCNIKSISPIIIN